MSTEGLAGCFDEELFRQLVLEYPDRCQSCDRVASLLFFSWFVVVEQKKKSGLQFVKMRTQYGKNAWVKWLLKTQGATVTQLNVIFRPNGISIQQL